MSEYENEPTTSPENSEKEAGGRVDLPPGFAPLAPPPIPSPIPPPRPPGLKPVDLSADTEVEEPVEDSTPSPLKPILASYPVKKPAVKVALLDPTKVYAKSDESEPIVSHEIPTPASEGFLDEPDSSDEELPEAAVTNKVEARYPSIKPVALDREKIYPVIESEDLEHDEGELSDGGVELKVEDIKLEDEEIELVEEEAHSEDEEIKLEADEVESETDGQEEIAVGFRAPKAKPVMLDPSKIYQSTDDAEDSGESEDSVLDDIELTLDEESAFEPEEDESDESSDEEERDDSKPVVADPEEVAELVAKKLQSSNEVEVLGPEREELSVPAEKVSKWAFWRRPSKRDQQLERISEGYFEMIDLVRSIRGQLDSQNENNVILRETLSHLPEAMKGLDKGLHRFSKTQQVVGKALGEINTQMKTYNEKDERLAVSMDGFNDTLKGMDDTSKATMKTFDRVQERMRDSDIRMENLFQNVQNTEEKVSDTMVRLQRNMAVMQYIFLGCLMVVIGVLVFTVIMKKDEPGTTPQTEQVETKPGTENE